MRRARGVRREDRVGIGLPVESPEDVLLEGQILERRLDHHVGLSGDRDEGLGLAEAREPAVDPLIDRVCVEIELCGATCKSVANPMTPALDCLLVDVVQHDFVAVLQGELGNPSAHGSGPDDPDDLAHWHATATAVISA